MLPKVISRYLLKTEVYLFKTKVKGLFPGLFVRYTIVLSCRKYFRRKLLEYLLETEIYLFKTEVWDYSRDYF